MTKESWYASKLSEMDVVRILDADNFVVDYDKERGMYRVSCFEDNHFKDECWFHEYYEHIELNGVPIETLEDAANWLRSAWNNDNLNIYYAEDKDCLTIEDYKENEITFIQNLQEFKSIL
jgi:hypothetical protein